MTEIKRTTNISRTSLGIEEKVEVPRAEKAISGTAHVKKPSTVVNMTNKFFGGDPRDVMAFMFNEVMVPAAKRMFVDLMTGGVNRLVYGDTVEDRSHRFSGRSSRFMGDPSYRRSDYTMSSSIRDGQQHRIIPERSRATHDFDSIIFDSRNDAEAVLGSMADRIEAVGRCTIADFYDMADVEPTYPDRQYGWTDLRGSRVQAVREGYLLDLPKPVVL